MKRDVLRTILAILAGFTAAPAQSPPPTAMPGLRLSLEELKAQYTYLAVGRRLKPKQWPNGARLALNFVLNYEEGSEPSFADGDGQSETGLTESAGQSQGVRGRDLAAESIAGHRRIFGRARSSIDVATGAGATALVRRAMAW